MFTVSALQICRSMFIFVYFGQNIKSLYVSGVRPSAGICGQDCGVIYRPIFSNTMQKKTLSERFNRKH